MPANGVPGTATWAWPAHISWCGKTRSLPPAWTSKSLGNLVFVSALRNSDVDPMAIRLVLLRHHYRSDWEWFDGELWDAVDTLADWRRALSLGSGAPASVVVTEVLAAMADDLDAPRAVAAMQRWVDATLGTSGLADTSDPEASMRVHALLDAALGLAL